MKKVATLKNYVFKNPFTIIGGQNIFTQIGAEQRKSQMQRWQIQQETQTK